MTILAQNTPATEMPALWVLGHIPRYSWSAAVALSQQSYQRTGHSVNCANTVFCLLSYITHSSFIQADTDGLTQIQCSWGITQLAQKALPCTTPAYPYREKGGVWPFVGGARGSVRADLQKSCLTVWRFSRDLNILIIKACALSPRDQCVPFPEGTASGVIHAPSSPPRTILVMGRLISGERRRQSSEHLQSHSAG